MNTRVLSKILKILFALIVISPQLASGAEEVNLNPDLGHRLANCGAFFSLLSRSKSEFSDGLKGFSVAAIGYATVAFSEPNRTEVEVSKSMIVLADEMPTFQRDKNAFKQKFESCIATLKTGEMELRPKMNDLMKEFIPEVFGGNQ